MNAIPAQLHTIAVNWGDIGEAQRAALINVIESTADLNRRLSQSLPRPGQALGDIKELRKHLGA